MERKKVLIIEDNELNLKLARSILQLSDIDVLEAITAENGIKLAKEEKPDLILMDIQLPGMDGLEATRFIVKDPVINKIPVIALTSCAMDGDKQKALDVGCVDYITKPIDRRDFLQRVSRVLFEKVKGKTSENSGFRGKPRILIVDDDPMNVKMLKAQFSNNVYEIDTAYGGQECFDKVAKSSPDLILLDVMMPEINGYEVTWKLKNNPKTDHIPIILVTALDSAEDKARGLEAGADEFLTKPVNQTELLARVNSMLRLKKYYEQLTLRTQSEEQFIFVGQENGATKSRKVIPRVLVVDDNNSDLTLITNYLSNQPYELLYAKTGETALEMAIAKKIDVMILDIVLPGMDGFEVCKRLKENDETRHIQVVMITCLNDLDSKITGVERGADDFLVKPINKKELRARIKALLRKKFYLDQIRQHYQMAINSAITDGLTGLYNHAYFVRYLELEIKRAQRQKYLTALIMGDIDDFKKVNDNYGHLAGDVLLREIADNIRGNVREIDLVARYGGEEFAIVLPYIDYVDAEMVAERILNGVRTYRYSIFNGNSEGKEVTLSLGIALCPIDGDSTENLIRKADEMLYKAKKKGQEMFLLHEMIRLADIFIASV